MIDLTSCKTVDSGTTGTYVYDGQGQRLRKTTGGVNTDYLRDTSGNVVTEVQGGSTFASGYVYLNGQLLTEYVNGNTYFAHHDHLGSARLLTSYSQTSNLNGLPCETQDYLPFGESQTLPSNYLLRGSAFDQSPWTNWDTGSNTITPDNTTAPDGSTTADKIVFASGANSRRVQDFNPRVLGGAAGKTFTYSIWIRADAPLTLRILLEDRVSGTYQNTSTYASVTTAWQQFTVTRTIRSGIDGSWAEVGNLYNNSVTTTIYVWGAQVTNSAAASCDLTFRFTSYERDGETGNDYANARYVESRMGRFLSPDPLMGDIADPQSLNRYSYVLNNPLRSTDPTGMTCHNVDGTANDGDAWGCTSNGGLWTDDDGPSDSRNIIGTMQGGHFGEDLARHESIITTGWDPELAIYRGPEIEWSDSAIDTKEQQKRAVTQQLLLVFCGGNITLDCANKVHEGLGDKENGLIGGNYNFTLADVFARGLSLDLSSCLGVRCGLFDSVHFNSMANPTSVHMDTANPYILFPGGPVHLFVDYILGKTLLRSGIPR